MMQRANRVLLSLVCVGFAGCHLPGSHGGAAPKGQVAATVDGKEITVTQLRAEIGNNLPTDPKQAKAVEQQALSNIVGRTLVADAAKKKGLDKTPQFAVQSQRANEILLAQALEGNLAAQVPAPTPEEVQSFMNNTPDMFAARKIYAIDQIKFPQPTDPSITAGLKPLDHLSDIAAYLEQHKVPFARTEVTMDAAATDPRLVQAIAKLPEGEIFVYPMGNIITANQIKSAQTVPLTGDQAIKLAASVLKKQRTSEAIKKQVGGIIAAGRANVQFNPQFKPANAPATAPASKS